MVGGHLPRLAGLKEREGGEGGGEGETERAKERERGERERGRQGGEGGKSADIMSDICVLYFLCCIESIEANMIPAVLSFHFIPQGATV